LGAGLILLVPYGIGTVTGAGVAAGSAAWTPTAPLVGVLPAVLARAVHRTVGTAGGVLVGVFALSALGILTVGWHPLIVLRNRDAGSGMRDAQKPSKTKRAPAPTDAPEAPPIPHLASRIPTERRGRAERTAPASRIPHP